MRIFWITRISFGATPLESFRLHAGPRLLLQTLTSLQGERRQPELTVISHHSFRQSGAPTLLSRGSTPPLSPGVSSPLLSSHSPHANTGECLFCTCPHRTLHRRLRRERSTSLHHAIIRQSYCTCGQPRVMLADRNTSLLARSPRVSTVVLCDSTDVSGAGTSSCGTGWGSPRSSRWMMSTSRTTARRPPASCAT